MNSDVPYCVNGCGERAFVEEPIGMIGDDFGVEIVCGRRWCRLRAKARHVLSDLLDAVGA